MERGNSLPLLSSLCAGRESLCYSYSWWRFFPLPSSNRIFFFFLVSPFPIRGLRIPLSSHHLTPRGEEGFLCLLFSVLTAPVFCFNISVWELLLFFPLFFFNLFEYSILSYKYMKPDTHFKFGYWQLWSKYNCIHLVLLSLLLRAN